MNNPLPLKKYWSEQMARGLIDYDFRLSRQQFLQDKLDEHQLTIDEIKPITELLHPDYLQTLAIFTSAIQGGETGQSAD